MTEPDPSGDDPIPGNDALADVALDSVAVLPSTDGSAPAMTCSAGAISELYRPHPVEFHHSGRRIADDFESLCESRRERAEIQRGEQEQLAEEETWQERLSANSVLINTYN